MLKKIFLATAFTTLFMNCKKPPKIQGYWNCYYMLDEGNAASGGMPIVNGHYKGTEKRMPSFFFDSLKMEYPMGFNRCIDDFTSCNYSQYQFNGKELQIESGGDVYLYRINFLGKNEFCIYKDKRKLACYRKEKLNKEFSFDSLTLSVQNENFSHKIFVSANGRVRINRFGIRNDSIDCVIRPDYLNYLKKLGQRINLDTLQLHDEILMSDESTYLLSLYSPNKTAIINTTGLNQHQFSIAAMIYNLEKLTLYDRIYTICESQKNIYN